MRRPMESRTPAQRPTLIRRPKRTGPLTALVLGGGGSRGAVGVGLYRAMVELGIPIDLIVSSSIGAVNGALIASGMAPEQLQQRWKALRRSDVVGSRWQLLRLLTRCSSLYSNHSLRRMLCSHLPVRSFSDLRIPLVIVGTDLETGSATALSEGDLIEAVLASTALPGLFPPIRWKGRNLVDGGLSDNVPIDLAVGRGAKRVFGMLCSCAKGFVGPATIVNVVGQSFSLAINARYRCDKGVYASRAELHILEPCFEAALDLLDFDRAWTLIEPAYQYALHALRQEREALRATSGETRLSR
jgi:NTE family protein